MDRYALTFRIKPASHNAVAELLADYRAPRLEIDDDTRLLGTAVFASGDVVVRAVEVLGDLAKVAPHLSRDPAIQQVERALVPHLADPYDPADPAARGRFFAQRLMERVTHRENEVPGDWPTRTRHALKYPIQPGKEEIATRVMRMAADPPLRMGGTTLLSTSVFRKEHTIVRIFEIDGTVPELVAGLSESVEVADVGQAMANLFAGPYEFTTRDGLDRFFTDNLMTTLTDRTAPAPEAVIRTRAAASRARHVVGFRTSAGSHPGERP